LKKKKDNQVANKRYLTLVLRLLVDQQGDLQRGEAVDISGKQVGQFLYLADLPSLVARWLSTSTGIVRHSASNNCSGGA
jgi:hypothetical protein